MTKIDRAFARLSFIAVVFLAVYHVIWNQPTQYVSAAQLQGEEGDQFQGTILGLCGGTTSLEIRVGMTRYCVFDTDDLTGKIIITYPDQVVVYPYTFWDEEPHATQKFVPVDFNHLMATMPWPSKCQFLTDRNGEGGVYAIIGVCEW